MRNLASILCMYVYKYPLCVYMYIIQIKEYILIKASTLQRMQPIQVLIKCHQVKQGLSNRP